MAIIIIAHCFVRKNRLMRGRHKLVYRLDELAKTAKMGIIFLLALVLRFFIIPVGYRHTKLRLTLFYPASTMQNDIPMG